jgi:hypothetical protein
VAGLPFNGDFINSEGNAIAQLWKEIVLARDLFFHISISDNQLK